MKIAKLRKAGDKLGREGMSLLAIQYIERFDGSHKGAMRLCGRLSVIAKMATCDQYWDEKTSDGIRDAQFAAEIILINANVKLTETARSK
tara:strand:- start:60 stop:329 length:270 start_codon:yes stop_codon:yes gene_type:complete